MTRWFPRLVAVAAAACSHPPASPGAPPPSPAAAEPTAPAPATATAPAVGGGGAPCFPDRPFLAATEMYQTLEKFAWSMYDEPEQQPTGSYGTCKVDGPTVTAADGTMVAELGCGVRVAVPGIRDQIGLEIGARGQDVIDRWPRPHPPLTCIANGPDQVRCRFDRDDGEDTDPTMYIVAGHLDGDPLRGPEADAWFAPRTVVEIAVSIWCH